MSQVTLHYSARPVVVLGQEQVARTKSIKRQTPDDGFAQNVAIGQNNVRRQRKGEHTCRCRAYKFPHRFGGGRCTGFWIVAQQWENNYGGGDCQHCNSRDDHECDVYGGKENVEECPVWQDFIRFEGIKV